MRFYGHKGFLQMLINLIGGRNNFTTVTMVSATMIHRKSKTIRNQHYIIY